MIELKRKEECCGCNACGDICPNNAISFAADKEGFWYPEVDSSKCVNCGLCSEVCPNTNERIKSDNYLAEPKCYVAEHKSMEVVFSSTSGGMFSALADVMYNENGYVGGAVHNEDFSVSHYISNDRADLQKLRRSKDLQSNAEGFYIKVRNILEDGNKALVCGLPCQIAGLQRFLKKDYDNLITADLVCAGVNSPKVWRKYLDYIEELAGSKIVYTENKSKEYGWHNLTQKFVFENGDEYFDTVNTSHFIKGYIGSHLYCRPSCYECKFKGFPRVADISIGDFWGIERFSSEHGSDMGTSLVLVNSAKGEEFFGKAMRRTNCKETPLEWALPGNPSLVDSMTRLSDKRDAFFDDLDKERFDIVAGRYSLNIGNKQSRAKGLLKVMYRIFKINRFNPRAVFQTLRYSGLKNLRQGKGIIFGSNCRVSIDKSAKLEFDGLLILGRKDKFPGSRLESRLFIGRNATLRLLGEMAIDAGSEIDIFDNAELVFHGGKLRYSDANEGLTVICGEKIEIMPDVGIGRNVMIRDTNGDHYINTTGYRPSRPVTIGEKAWLCESCTIMPGVRVGRGAIVGGGAFVTRSVPDHSMVSGNPANVVQENVIFKV